MAAERAISAPLSKNLRRERAICSSSVDELNWNLDWKIAGYDRQGFLPKRLWKSLLGKTLTVTSRARNKDFHDRMKVSGPDLIAPFFADIHKLTTSRLIGQTAPGGR
jgi:hypothetical protein